MKKFFEIILTPICFILAFPFIVWFFIYTFFEKKKYKKSECKAEYVPFITKGQLYKAFEIIHSAGFDHKVWSDGEFEYILCIEKNVCFLLLEYDGTRIYEGENENLEVDLCYEAREESTVDLSERIKDTETEQNCACYAVYDPKVCDVSDLDTEKYASLLISREQIEKILE